MLVLQVGEATDNQHSMDSIDNPKTQQHSSVWYSCQSKTLTSHRIHMHSAQYKVPPCSGSLFDFDKVDWGSGVGGGLGVWVCKEHYLYRQSAFTVRSVEVI